MDRLGEATFSHHDSSKSEIGIALVRIETDGFVQMNDGLIQASSGKEKHTQIILRIRGGWVESDRLGACTDGLIEVSLFRESNGEVVPNDGIARGQFYRLVQADNGF